MSNQKATTSSGIGKSTSPATTVRTGVRAGGMNLGNHNEAALPSRTGVTAGGRVINHNETAALLVHTGTRALHVGSHIETGR